jgi:fructuronate reductase
MLQLQRNSIVKYREEWESQGFKTYHFDDATVLKATKESPQWLHVGGGNLFRAFLAPAQQTLLEQGDVQTGIIVTTTHNMEVIDKLYRPYDNLNVAVTMYADGHFDKEVVGSIVESVACDRRYRTDWQRLKEIFQAPSLQMVSFTITEKGYKLTDYEENYTADVSADLKSGPDCTTSSMGNIAALLYERFKAGAYPVALVSMDNCSHNGDKVKDAIYTFGRQWVQQNMADADFMTYLQTNVTYPFSMIDKIVPGPSKKVQEYLKSCHFGNTDLIQAGHGQYGLFVNAEKSQYLVIEDNFPNGRPPLEKIGVIFTNRDTVNKAERMKVGTCLNPLHTTLAVYGCLLGYTLIADELRDPQLKGLIEKIGYQEGLPVVVDPGVLDPKMFLDELVGQRLPNPNVPDTPQRIATDTSQKVGVRFGETIKAYGSKADTLVYIPLAIAGWLRYLLGVDDEGQCFTCSPDPLLDNLQTNLQGITLGCPDRVDNKLQPILSQKGIFGCNLYEVGLGKKIEGFFKELIIGPQAVRNTLIKYTK